MVILVDNIHSLVGHRTNISNTDYYVTPSYATKSLLEREMFEGTIWECASGNGKMSEVITKYYPIVLSSDIRTDNSVFGEKGIDFLKANREVDNIITNPPFKYGKEFVEHSLKLAKKKVALLLRLNFLEGISRYNMFKSTPLKVVYVFCGRITMFPEGEEKPKNSGTIAYAWFIWDKDYFGKPRIEWINDRNI